MIDKKTYISRLARLKTTIKRTKQKSAILLSSAPSRVYSRDTNYPYSQDRNFFYLTGSEEPQLALLISSENARPIIFAPKEDKMRLVWEGPRYDLKTALTNTNAELVEYSDFKKEILSRLKGLQTLYYQNDSGSISWTVAKSILEVPAHRRSGFPVNFILADELLDPLRLHKTADEVKVIEQAIDISYNALCLAVPLMSAGNRESQVAALIDYGFRSQEAQPAFSTIVAAGKNAAVLHYHKLNSVIKKDELLLLDFGASYRGYAADISRTVPVSGRFTPLQKILYSLVLEAQYAAIQKIKHGVLIKSVYEAASSVIIEGLIDFKILKGKKAALLKKGAHKEFFPHGIGHSLGLDVHDPGGHRNNNSARLEKGMVFTVEPGIYFSKSKGRIKPCGIRIEDDVLVTQTGCKVLSGEIPKHPEDIEELIEALN